MYLASKRFLTVHTDKNLRDKFVIERGDIKYTETLSTAPHILKAKGGARKVSNCSHTGQVHTGRVATRQVKNALGSSEQNSWPISCIQNMHSARQSPRPRVMWLVFHGARIVQHVSWRAEKRFCQSLITKADQVRGSATDRSIRSHYAPS